MPNGEVVLSDEQISDKIEGAGAQKRVNPLDPDFLLISFFAITVDSLDLILDPLIVLLGAPKLIGAGLDVFTFVIIGGWIYWRVGKIAKSKEARQKALQKTIAKKGATLKKQLAKGIKSPLKKTLTRAGIAVIGEIAPFIGLIPFWTISVILTLREK